MKYIKEPFVNTYEEKKSKFMAYFMPYKDFDSSMKNLRDKHPKARNTKNGYTNEKKKKAKLTNSNSYIKKQHQ